MQNHSGVIRGPAGNNDCRIYVGNLPPDIRTKDIEDVFYKYGSIRDIDLKNRRGGPPFAFVEFEDPRDAEDAVYGRDGYDYDGYRLRVEFPRSGRGTGRGGGGGGGGGQTPRGRYGPPSRRSEYRVVVSGLPPSGSWQDLKDHMREAGDVCYADVFRDGTGVVEFVRKEDMTYAVRKLDNTKFRSHEGETAYIRVKVDGPRSPSYGRSRSRSAVEPEAVAEVAAEAVVTLPDEAEDLPATRPVIADHARVARLHITTEDGLSILWIKGLWSSFQSY
ncbi:LOW QUALITY PROTEIN: serine/arginine-rich splicing factor 1B [Stegostoma tigrinum]|uniref:LOW QUALITY PROTEIN: serine/arginine-rich splicing factor 1B n=1 Tax=Stegostoma tigrinum TaxID=3053191 RepID=UPI0028707B44|nr:LOW QUALITY PROTEIN: serine/arginine-rich splicing factor 1B [Stegostoma tigrinum]